MWRLWWARFQTWSSDIKYHGVNTHDGLVSNISAVADKTVQRFYNMERQIKYNKDYPFNGATESGEAAAPCDWVEDFKMSLSVVRSLGIWYSWQEFCLKWGTSTSVYFKTSNGVRCGGMLSPRLFSLCIDDISTLLADTQVSCYIDSTCVNYFLCADDMCLLAPSAIGLQKLINVCPQYGVVHDIIYHPVKSMCMTMLPKMYKLSIPSLSLTNPDFVYTESIKCLGVLNNNFNDDGDISRQLRCLYASSNSILRKFAYCTQKMKLHLLEWYCLNLYCSELWCDYSMAGISKLWVVYKNVFRNILGYGRRDSASSMFAINAIDTYEARTCKAYFTFVREVVVI